VSDLAETRVIDLVHDNNHVMLKAKSFCPWVFGIAEPRPSIVASLEKIDLLVSDLDMARENKEDRCHKLKIAYGCK
jgi:hypothetical protein